MAAGLSTRIERLVGSPIRDILAVIDQPGMVSFAGGLPATSCLPHFSEDISAQALQYGASEGDRALREHLADSLRQRGLDADAERVLVLTGSQQGIDLVAKLVIDEGTRVAVESPVYLAALQSFSLFGAQYLPFDLGDSDDRLHRDMPALLYTNPTFRNPDSHTYSTAQRRRLAQICDGIDTIVFEDDPYRELFYEDRDRTPVCAFLQRAHWVYQSSFSKTIAPGLRLGYLLCSPALYEPLLRLKQAADLHSSRVSQQFVLRLLKSDAEDARLTALRQDYRRRRDHFDALLQRHVGDIAIWSRPPGGLFFWLELQTRRPIDTRRLLPAALSAGVAFMPGEPFFADGRQAASALRLNFSHADPHTIEPALIVLADLLVRACG